MTGEWPLQDFIELGALTGAVPSARLHSRHVLWEWGQARLSENVELVVCELMTNAVAASGFAELVLPVRLWLLSDKTRVLILVWDANPRPPLIIGGSLASVQVPEEIGEEDYGHDDQRQADGTGENKLDGGDTDAAA